MSWTAEGDTVRSPRVTRRQALLAAGLWSGMLSLGDVLRCRALGSQANAGPPDTAVIHVFMGGGPSHIDTFDLKPDAPAEIRGEFRPIASKLPGVVVGEHVPALAGVLDRLAIVRSVCHAEPSHLPASHWMMTGYRPSQSTTTNVNPYCGAVVARSRQANEPGMPTYVSIPRRQIFGGPAYLGPAFNPFTTDSDPGAADFKVRNLEFPQGLDAARLSGRQELKQELDRLRGQLDNAAGGDGLDRFSREALEIISGGAARNAFDLSKEDPATRDRYGRTPAGQRCLLARRLVEAGVPFVTVLSGGEWDTHVDNFKILKENSLPPVDHALAALVMDLYERGLDRRVLLVVSGEFGRTPTINKFAGRDHWPGAMSVLFAGGGMHVGQVIGATDRQAAEPVTHRYCPGDVLATMYDFLGIDTTREFLDRSGRPLRILNEGAPIQALYS